MVVPGRRRVSTRRGGGETAAAGSAAVLAGPRGWPLISGIRAHPSGVAGHQSRTSIRSARCSLRRLNDSHKQTQIWSVPFAPACRIARHRTRDERGQRAPPCCQSRSTLWEHTGMADLRAAGDTGHQVSQSRVFGARERLPCNSRLTLGAATAGRAAPGRRTAAARISGRMTWVTSAVGRGLLVLSNGSSGTYR